MITLKHMARELNIEPRRLRIELRRIYGKVPGARWRWPTKEDKRYVATITKVRKALASRKHK